MIDRTSDATPAEETPTEGGERPITPPHDDHEKSGDRVIAIETPLEPGDQNGQPV